MAVEVRGPNGWRLARNFYPCSICERTGRWDGGSPCRFCDGTGLASAYHDRNYDLFAILADVRNFYSVGKELFPCWPPLAPHRGMPDDLGAELHAAIETRQIDLGDHSETWCTLAELEAYDWLHVVQPPGVTRAWSAKDAVGDFYTEFLPVLRTLGAPDAVRLVFAFDN